MPHITSSFFRPGRRAGGRRWSQIKWSRRRWLLKATARAETAQRLQEEAAKAEAAKTGREGDGVSSATARTTTALPSAALPSVTWRSGYSSTAEAMATPLLGVPHTPTLIPEKLNPAATLHVAHFTPHSSNSRSTTAPPEKQQPRHEGSVSDRRAQVPSWDKSRWCRRDCDTAVAPRLQTIAEPGGSLEVTEQKLPAASDAGPRTFLGGAEKHPGGGNSKGGDEVDEEEDGNEEEGEGGREEAEAEEENAEASSRGKDNVDAKKNKEKEEMKGEGGEDEVEQGAKKREKVGLEEKEEVGEEKEEMEEERGEVGVKEDWGEGGKKMEEEEGVKEKEEEVVEGKEGGGETKERGVVEEGEEVVVEEEKAGEESQPQEHQQKEQEAGVTAGVGVLASPIVAESSVAVDGVPGTSSVDAGVASVGVGDERGTLVPTEFRPSGREGDTLCTWDLSMVRPKTDAATLGAGAFGSVVEVRTQNGKKLAMKIVAIPKNCKRSRMRREAELLQECSAHPHVVDTHGSIDTPERLYIIMSKADTTLFSLMQAGVVDGKRAAECTRQLMSAVAFLHGRNIIHRDIKPANVLLRNGQVLLADFGLAKRTENCLFAEQGACGTVSYLAPELIIGAPYGLAIDMWAVGIVAFELLHGMHPFWEQAKLAFRNAEQKGAGSAKIGANRVSESSSEDSSESSVDVDGSSIDTSEDAGLGVGADDGGGTGGGALSSGTGVGSASVSAVEDAPSLVSSMSARRAELATMALFREKIKAAEYDVKEDLDPVARDFLKKLLQRLSPYRMTAAQAAKHPWLNPSSEVHAIHAWRSSVHAHTTKAMAVRRASRLDAAIFKAQRAAERAVGAVRQMEARAEGSPVLGQSTVIVSVAVVKATRDVVSTLRKCAQLATLMAAQALAARNYCAPSDVQGGDQGLRVVGSTAEHMADESVSKAESFAGEGEAHSEAAMEAVATWEGAVAEAEEEATEAADAAEAAAAVEAMFQQRRAVGGKKSARKRRERKRA